MQFIASNFNYKLVSRLFLLWIISLLLTTQVNAKDGYEISLQLEDGTTLEELSKQWWMWASSFENTSDDPIDDEDGHLCYLGNKDHVWFLAGTYDGMPVTRHCNIPKHKYIFFPVVNFIIGENPRSAICSEVSREVKDIMDTASGIYVDLSDSSLSKNQITRVSTKSCFKIPNDSYIYASDGYWVLLKFSVPGEYKLNFGTKDEFSQDNHYVITVD
ncbi:hypothetical protein [Bartonella sp. HY038]|uniref:hypothetical protein n=1 Tax=Bartonella sp. HY038 TaxID=2759660 RepID=UPI0015FA4669|nr:hypothetical protein [Bartonella sp. HY038]